MPLPTAGDTKVCRSQRTYIAEGSRVRAALTERRRVRFFEEPFQCLCIAGRGGSIRLGWRKRSVLRLRGRGHWRAAQG